MTEEGGRCQEISLVSPELRTAGIPGLFALRSLEEKESTLRRDAENRAPCSHSLRLFASASSPAPLRLRLFASASSPSALRLRLFAFGSSPPREILIWGFSGGRAQSSITWWPRARGSSGGKGEKGEKGEVVASRARIVPPRSEWRLPARRGGLARADRPARPQQTGISFRMAPR